jgi:hypothetical protein
MALVKILFAVHLKHSSTWSSPDVKPMSNDLMHAMPWQCMFALSMCVLCRQPTYKINLIKPFFPLILRASKIVQGSLNGGEEGSVHLTSLH